MKQYLFIIAIAYILVCALMLVNADSTGEPTTEKPKNATVKPTEKPKNATEKPKNTTENPAPKDNSTTTQNPNDVDTTTTEVSTDKNTTDDKNYTDITTFAHTMNLWDFRGHWAKFNLTHLKEKQKIPDIETSLDQVIFINEVNPFTSLLRKRFPPLENGTLSITYLLKFTDIYIVGIWVNTVEEKQVTFLNGTKDRWKTRNNFWITETFEIGSHNSSFEVIFKAKTSTSAQWAIDIITVRGIGEGKHSTNHSEIPPADVPPSWHNETETDDDDDDDNDDDDNNNNDSDLSTIASSMWQAFYAFIALFLLVVILFVILIIRQKKKKNIVEPVIGTYDHRPSVPSVKPHDNRSYQTDSV